MEQVFEICKCAEDDKGIKGNVTSSKPATLHDAINMAQELIEQGVQAKALRIRDSNKKKWEDQCKAHHQPGPCPPRCGKCHKLGHQEGECRTKIPVAGGTEARGMMHALVGGETNQNLNNMEDDINT
ncbi:hypothetical protein Tco_0903073 [Tanacetum coccineum]